MALVVLLTVLVGCVTFVDDMPEESEGQTLADQYTGEAVELTSGDANSVVNAFQNATEKGIIKVTGSITSGSNIDLSNLSNKDVLVIAEDASVTWTFSSNASLIVGSNSIAFEGIKLAFDGGSLTAGTGSSLIFSDGLLITSNSTAVSITGGNVEMRGGEITVDDKGDIGVGLNGGSFTMNGGAITHDGCYGINLTSGTCTLNGGRIYGESNGEDAAGLGIQYPTGAHDCTLNLCIEEQDEPLVIKNENNTTSLQVGRTVTGTDQITFGGQYAPGSEIYPYLQGVKIF